MYCHHYQYHSPLITVAVTLQRCVEVKWEMEEVVINGLPHLSWLLFPPINDRLAADYDCFLQQYGHWTAMGN